MNYPKKPDTTTQHGAQLSPNDISSKRSISPSLAATSVDSCMRPGSLRRDPGQNRPLPTKRSVKNSKRRSKKVGHRDEDATVVTIDQTRKAVGTDLYAAWFPAGERPTVEVSASREGVNLLGAVTEYGETTVLECSGSFTGEVTIHFLQHLQAEFGEKLVVLLDQATYFTAGAVKDFVAEELIELVYFPTGSPELNPTEEYW